MDKDTSYLVDQIIDYSEGKRIKIDDLASKLMALVKQRLPEYQMEREIAQRKYAFHQQFREKLTKTKKINLISRVIMVSWVHEIRWTYYPEFHIIDKPIECYAFPVRTSVENWGPLSRPEIVYIDDLFYDKAESCFWQPEPYLNELPTICKKAYRHLRSSRLERLKETSYRKVDPSLMTDLLEVRKDVEDYEFRACESENIYQNRPYGSKGWRTRISGVQRRWSVKRKSDWG